MEKQNETQQNTNKNKSKAISTLLIAITCLSVMIGIDVENIAPSNNKLIVKKQLSSY